MSVDPQISLAIIKQEIEACQEDAIRYGWEFSPIAEKMQYFTVKIKSPVDNEIYILEVKFDDYRQIPLYLEFIDPNTGEKGVKKAYPASSKIHGAFFVCSSNKPCICTPASRKAYKDYLGPHQDWTNIYGWEKHPDLGNLINLHAILLAIYSRISNVEVYSGRMA